MLVLAGNFLKKNSGMGTINSLCFCYNPVVWQEKILIKCCLRAVWTYLGNRQLLTPHLIDQHCVCQSGPLWSHIKDRQEEDWKHVGQAKVEREGSKDCRSLAQYKTVHLESHEPTNHSSKCRGQKGQNVGLNSHYRGPTESNTTGRRWLDIPLGQLRCVLCLILSFSISFKCECRSV